MVQWVQTTFDHSGRKWTGQQVRRFTTEYLLSTQWSEVEVIGGRKLGHQVLPHLWPLVDVFRALLRFAAIAKDLPGFRQLFCKGLCSALGLPAHGNCVEVLNVTNGSIIVEFLMRPRAHTDSRSAFELSQLLEKQLSSPYSALRRGPLGRPSAAPMRRPRGWAAGAWGDWGAESGGRL
ncbi:unnamed protein product [Durusdinium trenchii]|uniref:Uncharacterized protein n=1 Tax=Durusdinium trenchii TaxID=1381693 RepID=A0ABP0K7M1_9DINO